MPDVPSLLGWGGLIPFGLVMFACTCAVARSCHAFASWGEVRLSAEATPASPDSSLSAIFGDWISKGDAGY